MCDELRPASKPLSTSWWSSETDDEALERLALDIFLTEFTTKAADRQASRGFLDGIQPLLKSDNPQSSLVCSAKTVALASIGIRLKRKSLIRKTERQYGDLLGNLHQSLYAETRCVSIETLYTAILLGLYEIIISRNKSPMQYMTHVKGVCAILLSPRSPFRLEYGRIMFQPSSLLMSEDDIVAYWPLDDSYVQNLNATLHKFQDFSHRAELYLMKETAHMEESKLLQREALVLDEEFSHWGESITDHPSYARVTVASLDESAAAQSGCDYCHSGPVDTYSDHYIAAIWNTYRKSHIVLLDIMAHLERHISKEETSLKLQGRVEKFVADIIASIPYHLAYDVDEYLKCIHSQRSDIAPNRSFSYTYYAVYHG
ncbi:hypothetical protein TGAM01_v203496 [Trichoderma gamsii]|uniref:C6 zinc finger protein n=1 Tax=Trichoderma gamsii TaxID=398673 RepID=A0A2P4ZTV8_9HYPO|nr:hypothetical protein TGAM01_v203496 [Trichoderma gamsii]PON27729.1 hypothetical protein TGAM01_v203496 [Trichoderma gamsii]